MPSPSFEDAADWYRSFGATLRPQPRSEWAGLIPLPLDVEMMYLKLGPEDVAIPAYGNDILQPALADLWAFQEGYRWHALTGDPLHDWPRELLVVAHAGGDPIAFNLATSAVQVAGHGAGRWDFEPFTDSLAAAILGLAVLGSLVERLGPDLCDDDSLVRPENVEEAVRTLARFLDEHAAQRILRWAGWAY